MQDVAALNGAQPTPQMPLTSASPQSGQSAHTAGPLLTVQDQGSDDRGACMLLSDLRHLSVSTQRCLLRLLSASGVCCETAGLHSCRCIWEAPGPAKPMLICKLLILHRLVSFIA